MKIKKIEELLDDKISIVPWRYKILKDGDVIEFTNAEVRSISEEKFLRDLEEDGGSKVIESGGRTSYLIKREDDRLMAYLAERDGEIVDELGEITEKEVLQIREPEDKNEGFLRGVLSALGDKGKNKEPISNRIRLNCDSIEKINVKKSDKHQNSGLIISGEDFDIKLRGDGGCQIIFS